MTSRGTSQYSIPIVVPPGVNGLAPSLAISYSQETLNGLVGTGWSIAGFLEITRCPKSLALDGGGGPVTNAATDGYCLGGNRLRLTGGTYGSTSSTYQTAIETYARATVTGANSNGPTAWEVRKKDGLIYEYGNTGDSRIEVGGSAAVRVWAVNKISDRSGNSIDFIYQEDTGNGAYRPVEIRYGGNSNAGTAHTTKVVFTYETAARPDPIFRFATGSLIAPAIQEYKRLDRIDVIDIATAATVRTYDVTYDPVGGAGGKSRLSSIQESRGSDTLSATTMTWTTGTAGWASTETASSVTVPGGYLLADINGDNRTDVVFPTSTTSGGGVWSYMLGNNTGFGPAVATANSNVNFTAAQLVEWNGDGMMDLLVPCSGATTWCVMVANGAGFGPLTSTGAAYSNTQLATDVNCDGLDDLVRLDTSGLPNRLFTRIRSGSGYAAETLAFTSPLSIQKYTSFNVMTIIAAHSAKRKLDFNGDGCSDFLTNVRDDDPEPGAVPLHALAPFLGTSNGLQAQDPLGWQTQTIALTAAGDVNGDGLTDIIRTMGSTSLGVQAGTGGGLSSPALAISFSGYRQDGVYIADYDGDGLDDIVLPQNTTLTWHVSRSLGNSFSALASLGYSGGVAISPVDLNGDGGVDLVGPATSAGGVITFRLRNAPFPDYIDRITDGFGMYVDFDYVRLTNAGSTYTPGTGSVFPVIEYQGPMYVVSRMTSTTGTGSTYNLDYTYEAARQHMQGHGFLGFAKRTETDSRNGVKTEETYLQDPARYEVLGAPSLIQVKQSSGTLLGETSLTWGVLTAGSGATLRRYPYIASQVSKQYEVGGAFNGSLISTETMTVDGVDATSGLIYDSTTTTVEASSANGVQPGGSYAQRTYHPLSLLSNDTSSWCLGGPGQTQLINSHTLFGGAAVTRTTDKTWDAAKCRVTREVVEPNDAARYVAADLGYDTFGNLNSRTVTGRNPNGTAMAARVTTFDWGANGRFLRSVTNPLLQQVTFGWDEAIGVRTSLTDPNQLQTRWVYDNFGRLTRETRPDSTWTSVAYVDCAAGMGCLDANNKIIVVRSDYDPTNTFIRDHRTYLDRYDRPQATRAPTVSGLFARLEVRYDSLGRITHERAPCEWGNCATFWTQFSYDAMNRVTQISRPISEANPTAANANTYYEGLTTRVVDLQGKQTTSISNVIEAPVRATNHDGYYIQADYDAFGHPVRLIDSASSTVETATFDVVGRRTSSGVLGAGTRTFTYNSLGELVAQTDSSSQSVGYGYDALGRMTSRVDAQGTATWVWGANAAARNIGKLESKTGTTGAGESYLYDSFGRPSQTSVVLGSDGTHLVNFGYNTQGTLDSLTYPTSTSSYRLKLKYEYANGELVRIKDFAAPTTVFWAANATNSRGQITQETLGNGLVTTRGFDAVTGNPAFIRTGAGGGSTLQNLSYLWDAADNLVQRQDGNQGLTENVYYDNLYRVDYTQLNGAVNLDVAYDGGGRITSKQDDTDTVPESGTATWNANDLPTNLTGVTAQFSGSSQLFYDADGARYKQVATTGGTSETTLYIGGLLERVTVGSATTFRHYIQGPTGIAGIINRASAGTNSTYYTLRDHLGSIDKITNGTGALSVALSYSAYGQRRGANWTGLPSSSDWTNLSGITRRGFTGHEHLDNVGLIHMNGRVYQPSTARFLSADPFVDTTQGTQAHNRYAYLGNGPLSAIDPSGFIEEVVVSASRPRSSGGPVVTGLEFLNMRGGPGPNYFSTTIVIHREVAPPTAESVLEEVVVQSTRTLPPQLRLELERIMQNLRNAYRGAKITFGLAPAPNCNQKWVDIGNMLAEISDQAGDVSTAFILGGFGTAGIGALTGAAPVVVLGLAEASIGGGLGVSAGFIQIGAGMMQSWGGAPNRNVFNGAFSLAGGKLLKWFVRGPKPPRGYRTVSQRKTDKTLQDSSTITGGTYDAIVNALEDMSPQQASCP